MTISTTPAGIAIEQVDLREADDRLIDRVVSFWHAMDAEAVPEDPPMPREASVARLRSKVFDRTDRLAWQAHLEAVREYARS